MICEKCQNEVDEIDKYCRHCGNLLLHTDVDGQNVALSALRSICASKLFFVICILMSISTACELANITLPVFSALLVIFLWIIYNTAKKNELKINDFQKIDTTINLGKILVWVNVGFVAVILTALFSFKEEIIHYVMSLSFFNTNILSNYIPSIFLEKVNLLLYVCIAVFIVLLIALIVYNLTFLALLKKFVNSLLLAITSGSLLDIKYAKNIKNWLYIIATLYAVSALRGIDSGWKLALGATSKCAATIIAAIIIKETLIERNELQ